MVERAEDGSVTIERTVPFHDCDPLFVVWHGRYFEYMAEARAALLRTLELDVPHVRALGFRMYMSDVRCRYHFPLAYGDVVAIRARVMKTNPVLRVSYTLTNVTQGRLAARGYTDIAITDASGALLSPIPDAIAERLADVV